MNKLLGNIITAMVIDKNEKNVFVQKNGETIKVIDQAPDEIELGDMIKGFLYINMKNEYVLMTEIPQIKKENYGLGEVVEVQRNLGVFVDVGWEEKDLVVSMDDLPIIKNVWPRKGDQLILSVKTDDKNRMWGKLIDLDHFLKNINSGTKEMQNQDISGFVTHSLKAGSYVLLDNKYIGFIHPKEREKEPRLGEKVDGRVIGVREDGVLYLSLLPRAHEVLDTDASMILEVIKRSKNHSIAYHDKSNPDDIRSYFGISKGQFKRAVGRLMKNGLVKQDDEKTFLTDKGKEQDN